MDYLTIRKMWRNRHAIFEGHNGADGTSNDTSTDAIITRNPNDYVLPRLTSFNAIHGLAIAIGVLAVIILLPIAIKTIKNVTN